MVYPLQSGLGRMVRLLLASLSFVWVSIEFYMFMSMSRSRSSLLQLQILYFRVQQFRWHRSISWTLKGTNQHDYLSTRLPASWTGYGHMPLNRIVKLSLFSHCWVAICPHICSIAASHRWSWERCMGAKLDMGSQAAIAYACSHRWNLQPPPSDSSHSDCYIRKLSMYFTRIFEQASSLNPSFFYPQTSLYLFELTTPNQAWPSFRHTWYIYGY